VATTTDEADHVPRLVTTVKPFADRSTLSTAVSVTIGAVDEAAYRSKNAISSGTDMKPSGSLPSYWKLGRRVIQFGRQQVQVNPSSGCATAARLSLARARRGRGRGRTDSGSQRALPVRRR
jgi:hypothetical protein